jgi:hypothetical protein
MNALLSCILHHRISHAGFRSALFGSIRLEYVTNNSIVLLGPCSTSVYMEGCENSIIYILCHQLRIHKTKNCHLFVRCQSNPIIEDCEGLIFSPYPLVYPDIDMDIQVHINSTISFIFVSCFDSFD